MTTNTPLPLICSLVLIPALALARPVLSPEAREHNSNAMRHWDAGQLGPAADEFTAAYATMPDARADRAGREQLLGSLLAALLGLHSETGQPAPLCRLQDLLRAHADALAAAYPEAPDDLELRSVRARHEEVTQQLASFGPDVCAPPPLLPVSPPAAPTPAPAPTLISAPVTPAPAPMPAAPPRPTDNDGPRRQQLVGAVLLPLGLVALAGAGALAPGYRRDLASAETLHSELTTRPATDDDRTTLRELLADTRRDEATIVALGLTAGAMITAGTALLLRGGLQQRRARLGLGLHQRGLGLTLTGAF